VRYKKGQVVLEREKEKHGSWILGATMNSPDRGIVE
jgi:hypothetical protein